MGALTAFLIGLTKYLTRSDLQVRYFSFQLKEVQPHHGGKATAAGSSIMEQGTADGTWGQTIKPQACPVTCFSARGPTSFVSFFFRERVEAPPPKDSTISPNSLEQSIQTHKTMADIAYSKCCGGHSTASQWQCFLNAWASFRPLVGGPPHILRHCYQWSLVSLATQRCTSVSLLSSPDLNGAYPGCSTQTRLWWKNEHRCSVLFKTPVSIFVSLM